MVGYILLITFGIVISIIVYSYLKTDVPKDFLKCPEGVSIFIEDLTCGTNATTGNFDVNVTVQNNGKFNIAGYFIHGANDTDQELAVIDLSSQIDQNLLEGPVIAGSAVIFKQSAIDINYFQPNNETTHYFFNITQGLTQVEIIPMRYETKGSTQRIASCGDSKVLEAVSC